MPRKRPPNLHIFVVVVIAQPVENGHLGEMMNFGIDIVVPVNVE
jgi:hypothetical protein